MRREMAMECYHYHSYHKLQFTMLSLFLAALAAARVIQGHDFGT